MIPIQYNLRNLLVRWKTTLITGLGFTLVVALLAVMLGFVQGLQELSKNTGRPGNVIILRDGATDEVFSEISARDIHENLLTFCRSEQFSPFVVKIMRNGEERPLVSEELYTIATQQLPPETEGARPRYRFLQVRGLEDPEMSGLVHNLRLKRGQWFSPVGNECVLGQGIANTLGLDVGSTFKPDPRLVSPWRVVGILDSEGSAFDSEIWAKITEVGGNLGKGGDSKNVSSIVVTTKSIETAEQASAAIRDLKSIKVNALPEKKYYEELSKSNEAFLWAALVIAIVMAIGGMFGLMNTMFAAVSQRIKDLGVLRILGFTRGQILVSFLLESLLIAIIGGALGLLLAWGIFDGMSLTGQMSSGQGAGKTVVFKMLINETVLLYGVGFTLAMGVVGGLLPAWSAMRLKALESLR